MELSDVFGGDLLKAADLQGREPTVVIASVKMKQFDNGNKLIIQFQNKKKAFVCNKTNANRIAYIHGSNTDGWVGKEIQLYTDLVDFQGKATEAIRIRPAPKRAATVTSAGNGRQHVVTHRDGYDISEMRPAPKQPDGLQEALGETGEEIPF